MKKANVSLALTISILISTSCSLTQDHVDKVEGFQKYYSVGDFDSASEAILSKYEPDWRISKNPEKGTLTYGDNAVLWNLELGKVLLDSGRYDDALLAFTDAETIINQDFNERAVISVRDASAETKSALTNQKAIPYSGKIFDRILLNTFKAKAYLLLNNIDGALVEARRIDESQQDALAVFKIDKQEEIEKAKSQGLEFQTKANGHASFTSDLKFMETADSLGPQYASFMNPWASLIRGICFRIADNPHEQPLVDFRNLSSMLPNNPYVQEEFKLIKEGKSANGSVYLFFEEGQGPRIKTAEIAIPLGYWKAIYSGFQGDNNIFESYFMALPDLSNGKPGGTALVVSSSDGTQIGKSSLVADMAKIQAFELKERMSMIIGREFIRVVTQEIANRAVTKVAEKQWGDDGKLVAGIAGLIAKKAFNKADDRNWTSLGYRYQFLRVDSPPDNKLQLSLQTGGANPYTVTTSASGITLVFVRSLTGNDINVKTVVFNSELPNIG